MTNKLKKVLLSALIICLIIPFTSNAQSTKVEFMAKVGRLYIPMSYTSDGILTIGKIDYSYDGTDKYDSWIDEITKGYHYYDEKQQKEVYDTVKNNSEVYFPSEDAYYTAKDGVEHIKSLMGSYDVKRIELGEDVTEDFIKEISYISTDDFDNKFNMVALATIYNKYIYTPLRNADYINISAIYPFFNEEIHTLGYPASVTGAVVQPNKSVTIEAGRIRLKGFNFNVYNADRFNAKFTGTATMFVPARYMYANKDKLRVITNGGSCSGSVDYKKYPRIITVHLKDNFGNGNMDIDADIGYSMEKNPELDLYGKPVSNPYTSYTIPVVPKADYYEFKEWSLKEIEPFTEQAEYTATASYTPKTYEIMVGCDKAGAVNPNEKVFNWSVDKDDIILKDATAEGYVFDGWYDVNTDKKVTKICKDTVEPDVTQVFIISKFYAKRVKIMFDADNGELYEAIVMNYDDMITSLPFPKKDKYVFKGWFNGDTEIKVNQLCKFEGDVTLKAKWAEESPTDQNPKGQQNDKDSEQEKIETPTEEGKDITEDKQTEVDADVTIKPSDEPTNPNSKYKTSKDSDITADELKSYIIIKKDITDKEKKKIVKYINKATTQDETVFIKKLLKKLKKDSNISYKAVKSVEKCVKTIRKKAKAYKIKNLKAKPLKKKINLTWKRVDKVKTYQIQLSSNKKFKNPKNSEYKKTFSFTSKTTNFTIKGLKKKKTYYVRVRTVRKVSNNSTVYGKWSSVKKVKTK